MRVEWAIGMALAALPAAPVASGKLYRYQKASGEIVIVDKLSDVPERYRDQIPEAAGQPEQPADAAPTVSISDRGGDLAEWVAEGVDQGLAAAGQTLSEWQQGELRRIMHKHALPLLATSLLYLVLVIVQFFHALLHGRILWLVAGAAWGALAMLGGTVGQVPEPEASRPLWIVANYLPYLPLLAYTYRHFAGTQPALKLGALAALVGANAYWLYVLARLAELAA